MFLKVTAGILTALILWISTERHSKDISVLLTIFVCVAAITAAISFVQPIIDFIQKIKVIGDLDNEYVAVMVKVVGIGIITEISAIICKDAGNASFGKALQLLASVVILWMSIPIFEKLFSLFEKILGNL